MTRSDGPLSVDARQPLSRDTGVALVQVEHRRLLVGYCPTGVTLLDEVERKVSSP